MFRRTFERTMISFTAKRINKLAVGIDDRIKSIEEKGRCSENKNTFFKKIPEKYKYFYFTIHQEYMSDINKKGTRLELYSFGYKKDFRQYFFFLTHLQEGEDEFFINSAKKIDVENKIEIKTNNGSTFFESKKISAKYFTYDFDDMIRVSIDFSEQFETEYILDELKKIFEFDETTYRKIHSSDNYINDYSLILEEDPKLIFDLE